VQSKNNKEIFSCYAKILSGLINGDCGLILIEYRRASLGGKGGSDEQETI
jgi:hypothetical protein